MFSRRWFEPSAIKMAIVSMLQHVENVPAKQLDTVQADQGSQRLKNTMIASGGAALFIAIVVGALVAFAEPEKGKKPNYVRFAMFSVLIVGGIGVVTWVVSGKNNALRAGRDVAFEEIARRHPQLRSVRHHEFQGSSVGSLPWFQSEEWIHVYGLLAGQYQGGPSITVECTHVIDPVLAATDSALVQGLSGLAVGNRHKRLRLRAMDATVFIQPVEHLPDLLIVPKQDPSRAYYKRELGGGQEYDVSRVSGLPRKIKRKYWVGAADPGGCESLFNSALTQLLTDRKWCIVQVIGGYCVVMTKQWSPNMPSQASRTEEAITSDLDFAHAVYAELAGCQASDSDVAVAEPIDGSVVPSGMSSEQPLINVPAAVNQNQASPAAAYNNVSTRRRQRHSILKIILLLVFGLPLLAIGSLGTLGFGLTLYYGHQVASWPTADATIVASRLEETERRRDGRQVAAYRPHIEYTYEAKGRQRTNDRLRYGVTESSYDREEVEAVLAKYPEGAVVPVYHSASFPSSCALETGISGEKGLIIFLSVTGAFMLIGGWMTLAAVIGKRVRKERPKQKQARRGSPQDQWAGGGLIAGA